MFKNIYPLFERKRVLKKEMLENLRDYPRDMFTFMFQEYANGILTGCRIEARMEKLVIHPGIVYHSGIPYFLDEPYSIPYHPTGTVQYLKIHFSDRTEGPGQEEHLTKVILDEEAAEDGCEMELVRFKLQEGAKLRDQHVDFFDHSTEFDTLQLIHAPYASPEQSSIAPQILKAYAAALMVYPLQNPWDCAFCLEAMKGRILPYEEICTYLNARMREPKAGYTNMEIYDSLRRLVLEVSGKEISGRRTERKERKLLLM